MVVRTRKTWGQTPLPALSGSHMTFLSQFSPQKFGMINLGVRIREKNACPALSVNYTLSGAARVRSLR